MAAFVAYYRVCTDRQGRSRLGLDAQREAVACFLAAHPGTALLGEFTEVESGRRADRPQLAAALALARRRRATLVIAKLDRLARSVAFIAGLMEGCRFQKTGSAPTRRPVQQFGRRSRRVTAAMPAIMRRFVAPAAPGPAPCARAALPRPAGAGPWDPHAGRASGA